MNSYLGLYVLRDRSDGSIQFVLATDSKGFLCQLTPAQYAQGDSGPEIDLLRDFNASPFLLALARWVKHGAPLSDDTISRFQQFGWATYDAKGQLGLTPPGRQTLLENSLL